MTWRATAAGVRTPPGAVPAPPSRSALSTIRRAHASLTATLRGEQA